MTEAVVMDVEDEPKDKEKERRKWLYLSPIAKPLVTKKLNKKALKVVKKGTFSTITPSPGEYLRKKGLP